MTITVSAAPGTSPPNKYGGDPVAFDAAMQAHLDWQAGRLVTELNAQNAENNAINNNVNAALGAATSIGNLASTAAASAAAAAVSADRAVTAWAVASEPAEAISGKSKILHQGTIVASCIDLPSKHSDGGAWIDRCQDKSWYNETLGGTAWLNTRCGSEAIARAVIQSAAMPEKVTNGTFADGTTTGWTTGSSTLSVSSGALLITNVGSVYGSAKSIAVPCVIGNTYVFSVTKLAGGTATDQTGAVGTTSGGSETVSTKVLAMGVNTYSFVATATSHYITLYNYNQNNATGYYDNISVKEVDTTVSAAGYVYQSSADNKFYSLTGSSGQSEVFRGIKREYPRAGFLLILEDARWIAYDAGTGAMWGVYAVTTGLTSIAATNGVVYVGRNGSGGLYTYHFSGRDKVFRANASGDQYCGWTAQNLASLHNYSGVTWSPSTNTPIVHGTVNSVAITSLPNAPIDPGTGLPVPTIAVATAGGVSIIKDDGTVVNGSNTGSTFGLSIADTLLFTNRIESTGYNIRFVDLKGIAASWAWTSVTTPSTSFGASAPVGGTQSSAQSTFAGTGAGLVALKNNPTTPASGMVAYVTNAYNSGWQVGAIKGAYLSDTTAETVTGVELVTNGDGSSTTGWTAANATLSIVSGKLRVTATGTGYATAEQYMSVTALKTYLGQASGTIGTASSANISIGTSGAYNLYFTNAPAPSEGVTFTPASGVTSVRVTLHINSNTAGQYSDFDNISVKLAEPDRSVKGKGLIVNGSLTKTAVASGAGLVAYSGFNDVANYLWQPYNSDLDFGTGDFYARGWCNLYSTSDTFYIFGRAEPTATVNSYGKNAVVLRCVAGAFQARLSDNAEAITSISAATPVSAGWHFVVMQRVSGTLTIYCDTVAQISGAAVVSLTNSNAVLRFSQQWYNNAWVASNPNLTLWHLGSGFISADQISQIYRDELPLFQANAQCTLAGTSPAITALSFDEDTSVLHAGTSYGRSSFKGLLRVESEATTVGSPTSIAASGGHIVMGGTSAKLYTPAKYLRDELQRRDVAKKALGSIPVFFPFAAVTSQVAFVLPAGYTTKAVYSVGALKDVGSTLDYTVNTDGYKETVTFAVAPGNGVRVNVMAIRNY